MDLCATHYIQRYKGRELAPIVPRGTSHPVEERLWPRLEVGDCWRWTGALDTNGYGVISTLPRGTYDRTHRIVWRALVGEIPEGMEIDHLCRNRACANPDHMELVTHTENMRRGIAGVIQSRKTHCPQGHEYTSENTYRHNGRRHCRSCMQERSRAHRARRQMATRKVG